jgi:hypothetical protein
MKRLYAKYNNVSVRDARPTGYSDERLGGTYRVAEILHSVLSKAIMKQLPVGKIHAEGGEDFAGKQAIDQIHAKQQRDTRVYNLIDSALLYSVICGTGFIMPGWDHHIEKVVRKQNRMIQFANPADPATPIEIPTGETEDVEIEYEISRLDGKLLQPWNVFPVAGATSMFGLHTLTFRVPFTRKELYILQRAGELDNIDKIDFKEARGGDLTDEYIDETDVHRAKKEDNDIPQDRETVWMLFSYTNFPYYKYTEHVDEEIQQDDEFDCLIVKPERDNVICKLEMMGLDVKVKPGIPFKYGGTDDMFFGISPLEIAEALMQLDEDMFNWTMDRAKREVYRKWGVLEGVDTSQLSQSMLDGIVTVPSNKANNNINNAITSLDPGNSLMPHLQNQRSVVYGLIDEITAVVDFVRGAGGDEDETATKTMQRTEFISTRFGKRINYFERNGLWWWMQWQTVLNVLFLEGHEVERITGYPAHLNPFKLIDPIIPMQSYDFGFEASSKAVDDPVKAQILRGVLEIADNIGIGQDEQGNFVLPNKAAMYRDLIRKLDLTEDMEEYFITAKSPQELMMLVQMGGNRQAGGGPVSLGATTPGEIAAGITPKTDATGRP